MQQAILRLRNSGSILNSILFQGSHTRAEELFSYAHQFTELGADVLTVQNPWPLPNLHLLYNPSLMGKLMAAPQTFQKMPRIQAIHCFGGETGIFSASYEAWQKRRAIATEVFGEENFEAYTPIIQSCANALIEQWSQTGLSQTPHRDLKYFAGSTMLSIMFGESYGVQTEQMRNLVDALGKAGVQSLQLLLSIPRQLLGSNRGVVPEMKQALGVIDDFLNEIIHQAEPSLIVRRFMGLHGYDPRQGQQNKQALANTKEEIFQILLEVIETTSSGLYWTLKHLAETPDWQDKVQQGAHRDIKAVLLEALRTSVVFPASLPRIATENAVLTLTDKQAFEPLQGPKPYSKASVITVKELHIYRGDILVAPLQAINWNHHLHYDAGTFRPERQYDTKISNATTSSAFLTGHHMCSGRDLYMLIARIFVSSLLEEHHIARTQNGHVTTRYGTATAPSEHAVDAGLTGLSFSHRASRKCPYDHGR